VLSSKQYTDLQDQTMSPLNNSKFKFNDSLKFGADKNNLDQLDISIVNKIGGDIESIGPVSDRDFNRGTDEYPREANKVTRVKNLMIEKKREEKPTSMSRMSAANDEYTNGRKEAIIARKYVSKKNAQTSDRSYQESDNEATKKVGVYLEKMRERNSSLQERLNLSFKNSSRLDKSAITCRPSTTLK
jgi:hypothetical protein